MKKIFYLIDNSVMQQYEWIQLVNYPYSEKNLHIIFEHDFWFDLRHNKKLYQDLGKQYALWSIPKNQQTEFICLCKEVKINPVEIDLEEYYADYVERNYVYSPSKQTDIPAENMLIVCSQDVDKIICGSGTKQVFLEHIIAKKDNIQIYMNSNEITGHNIPHCHVKYNDINNYCVLSLVDYEKIAPDGNIKNAVVCRAQKLLEEYIQDARKKWNEIKSPQKFKVSDGKYTSEHYKEN